MIVLVRENHDKGQNVTAVHHLAGLLTTQIL